MNKLKVVINIHTYIFRERERERDRIDKFPWKKYTLKFHNIKT